MEKSRSPSRIGWALFFLLFLLAELALGAREQGALAPLLKPYPEPPGLLHTLAVLYAYVNAFATLLVQSRPLLLAGLIMGSLVLRRALRTREGYLRTRLILAVVGYFAFTVAAAYVGSGFPVVPNPEGTGLPALTLDTWLSLALFVVPALSFGRGSYCGVICPAATYWGGLGQTFIPQNRRDRGFETTARYTRSAFLLLFALSTVLSVTDSLRLTRLSLFGADPAVFFSGLTWMAIWYLMLVAVPFWGNRAFTRLICPMGSFLGWVARFGAFRVRALDAALCRTSGTRWCQASKVPPPVAKILAIRGDLRHPGCVGCGNSQAACPHGNIVYDNLWTALRRRLPARPPVEAPLLREA